MVDNPVKVVMALKNKTKHSGEKDARYDCCRIRTTFFQLWDKEQKEVEWPEIRKIPPHYHVQYMV